MKTCLINLDLINDICHPKGKLAKYTARIEDSCIIEKINQLSDWARSKKYLVAHVKLAFRPNYIDSSLISPLFSRAEKYQALKASEWGTQLCDTCDVHPDDVLITKHRVSAFYGTDLDLILRANCIEHLILTGVATNNAVELTAREAHDRDFHVTIVSDATETANDEEKASSLNFLSRIANVLTCDEIMG